jgi:hypothetical protein
MEANTEALAASEAAEPLVEEQLVDPIAIAAVALEKLRAHGLPTVIPDENRQSEAIDFSEPPADFMELIEADNVVDIEEARAARLGWTGEADSDLLDADPEEKSDRSPRQFGEAQLAHGGGALRGASSDAARQAVSLAQ